MPGWENAYLSVTGSVLGIRESRHVNALYQLTADDITSGQRFDYVVALGAWAMEYHDVAGKESKWISVKDKGTYDVPLRTLTSVDTPNLYAAGHAADGDQYAGAPYESWARRSRRVTLLALQPHCTPRTTLQYPLAKFNENYKNRTLGWPSEELRLSSNSTRSVVTHPREPAGSSSRVR